MKSQTIQKPRSTGARKSIHTRALNSKTKPHAEKQLTLLPNQKPFFGGELMKKAKGRLGSRPLAVKRSMHIVLRSSKAVGSRSFQEPKNRAEIQRIIGTHATRNYVRVLSTANVGNHIHLHIQLGYRDGYFKFIRAVTAAIAMHVMNWNRWTLEKKEPGAKSKQSERADEGSGKEKAPVRKLKFWDYRPYTNVVTSWSGFLKLKEYVQINQFQAGGLPKDLATLIVRNINPLTEAQDGPPLIS